MSVTVMKRGHHADFALTDQEIKDLISFCADRKTRAMLTLASLGVPVRGIVAFQANLHLTPLGLDIIGITEDVIPLYPKQYQLLSLFPTGFGVTNVTIWRKIKKVIVAAKQEGIIAFPDERVPFPAALTKGRVEEHLSALQMVKWSLQRVHSLQTGVEGVDFGTVDRCPHKDCNYIRRWLKKEGS